MHVCGLSFPFLMNELDSVASKQILKKAPEEAATKAPAVKEEPVSAPTTVPAVQLPVASSSAAHPPAASGAPSASGMSF